MNIASIQVEMLAGSSIKESLREAQRLAKLLNVHIQYTFNGVKVCVSAKALIYALEGTAENTRFYKEWEQLCQSLS